MAIVQLDAVSFRYPVFQVANRSLKIAVMRQMAGGRIEGAERPACSGAVGHFLFARGRG